MLLLAFNRASELNDEAETIREFEAFWMESYGHEDLAGDSLSGCIGCNFRGTISCKTTEILRIQLCFSAYRYLNDVKEIVARVWRCVLDREEKIRRNNKEFL